MSTATYSQAATDLISELRSDKQLGLSVAEAARRLEHYGPNRLQEAAPRRWWMALLSQFNELIVWILIAAAVLAGVLGDWTDALAIALIVLMNGLIGFVQEGRAERALESLKRLSTPQVRLLRGGQGTIVSSDEIVPGDIVLLEAGDIIPADGRLISSYSLAIQESALTGESLPVEKQADVILPAETPLAERRNMAFLATTVASGRAVLLVTTTGMMTELGQIARLLTQTAREKTPLQRRLAELGQILLAICLVIVGVIFVLQLMRGERLLEVLLLAISLAVAAIPEGLPAVVTVALALGLQRMVHRKALVRKLPSVETLGSVTVICTDKTGTLTRNEMTVRELQLAELRYEVTGVGYVPKGEFVAVHPDAASGAQVETREEAEDLDLALLIGARCNNSRAIPQGEGQATWSILGDPTEGALIVAALKRGLDFSESEWHPVFELPFDSDRKMMSILIRQTDGRLLLLTKGAPEMVLARCLAERQRGQAVDLTPARREFWLEQNRRMASGALRVLALACREVAESIDQDDLEQDLVLCGLVGMIDPPREEVATAVARCRQAGIQPIMITGDHPATALAIARELGIADERAPGALTGQQLEQLSDDELQTQVISVAVYARATAAHKLRIVQAWQRCGQTVAMTGDGVNDAPAVKAADIGIAMGITGTEVTKEASDMVLMDDNFASIVNAVEEGRGIYDNIQKVVQFLLAGNAGEVLFMFFAALLGWPAPLHPIQILWINLITDGLPAMALALEPPESDLMQRPPRPAQQSVITRLHGLRILLHGILIAMSALVVFGLVYRGEQRNLAHAQSMAFCVMACSQLAYVLACRSRNYTFPEIGWMTNPTLFAAVAVSALLQFSMLLIPAARPFLELTDYPLREWSLVLTAALFPVTVVELVKLAWRSWAGQLQISCSTRPRTS